MIQRPLYVLARCGAVSILLSLRHDQRSMTTADTEAEIGSSFLTYLCQTYITYHAVLSRCNIGLNLAIEAVHIQPGSKGPRTETLLFSQSLVPARTLMHNPRPYFLRMFASRSSIPSRPLYLFPPNQLRSQLMQQLTVRLCQTNNRPVFRPSGCPRIAAIT